MIQSISPVFRALGDFLLGVVAGAALCYYRHEIYKCIYDFWLWRRWRKFMGINGEEP